MPSLTHPVQSSQHTWRFSLALQIPSGVGHVSERQSTHVSSSFTSHMPFETQVGDTQSDDDAPSHVKHVSPASHTPSESHVVLHV